MGVELATILYSAILPLPLALLHASFGRLDLGPQTRSHNNFDSLVGYKDKDTIILFALIPFFFYRIK